MPAPDISALVFIGLMFCCKYMVQWHEILFLPPPQQCSILVVVDRGKLIVWFPWYCTDRVETDASSNSSVVVCLFVAVVTSFYQAVALQRLMGGIYEARHWHGLRCPVATTMETGCFLRSPCRDVITRTVCSVSSVERQFCTGGCEDRTWEREAEESTLLEAVARERLVKTQQAGKSSAGGVVNCGDIGGAVITCTYESCV
jgi:hypothetical protein